MLPLAARSRNMFGGTRSVHSCRPDPIVVSTSPKNVMIIVGIITVPMAFHVLGWLSKERA